MIEDILPRYQEVATGNKTAFTVPFETIDSSYINVYLNSTKQTTGYTVSGKTITFGTAPASSTVVTIVRVIPISWEHTVLGAIDQNSLNKIFTEIIAKMQTLEEGLERAIKTDVTDTESGSDYFLSLLADAMDSLAQAQTKLTQVQSAATQALSDISTAKTTAISDFNTNASTKTTDFNTNASTKTTNFNTNATDKTTAFNTNATNKTTAFDNNASTKTGDFNSNATSKTTTFNNNATSKTSDFDTNASNKTTAFNNNAATKQAAVDASAAAAAGSATLAENWATKTDGKVDGTDYSAKYYAQQIIPIATDISTLAGISSDVSTVADIATAVSNVSANSTSVTTVADISSNVTDVANNASNINAVADDLTKINAVADDLTNIDNASSYANLAKDWATKTTGKVDGNEYSAKYYAQQTASLLSTKQDKIDSSHKLASDLVSDANQTNKFVTATEKAAISTALQPNDNISNLHNDTGYITGISSTDVTTALGYTPYNSTNPNGYQANVIETVKVNGTALTPSGKAVDVSVPTTTNSVTSGSTEALTSGGAYTNLVRRLSTSAATGSTSQGVYVDANGQVQTCDAVTSTYSGTGTAPVNGTAVKSAIDAAIASVYKPAGSVAFANLPSPVKALNGNVYDVTDAFTTDSKFITSGQSYPAGTNVVVINTTGTTYKYDVLPGFVDLTPYQLKETAVTHTKNTTVGSGTQPVYIASDGTATATTYTLEKSVPSNAVFTDTTYSDYVGATTEAGGTAGLVPAATSANRNKFLRGDATWQTPTDTKNTAGGDDTASKIFLVGMTAQTTSNGTSRTYTQDTAFVDADGRVNSAAPASNANDTTVATTKWVKDQSYQGTSTAVTHTASTAVGSGTQPVYIASDGKATATTYTLEKSVPSNAVFTDTTYSAFTGANGTTAGTAGLVPAPAATDNNKFLRGDGTWVASSTSVAWGSITGTLSSQTDLNTALSGKANDSDVVKLTGDQTVAGIKTFSSEIKRTGTLSAGDTNVINTFDSNNKGSTGMIAYYTGNQIYNRLIARNSTGGKVAYLDIVTKDNGDSYIGAGGNATILNTTAAESGTTSNVLATKGWVNNPSTSTNVVHRSGDETINGTKVFNDSVNFRAGVELKPTNTATNGGYIDFHYAGDLSDFTSRIIENASGQLLLSATYVKVPTPTEDTTSSVQADTVGARNTKLANYALNTTFTGADGTNAGAKGLVPAPAATDNDKFLKGDGTWATPSGGGSGSSRNVGEIVQSTIPLTDAGLHLIDGSLISGSGSYSDFVTYIAGLVSDYPDLFTTEVNWQQSVTDYGVCGKFVYDSTNQTVRLPKYSNKFWSGGGTTSVFGNGKTLGLTNGTVSGGLIRVPGNSNPIYGLAPNNNALGANVGTAQQNSDQSGTDVTWGVVTSGESGLIANLSNITTALDGYWYIVIATSTKTQIEVDIDEIATDLNGKADVDLTNCTKPHIVETYISGTSWYRVYSDGWCEQGGRIIPHSGSVWRTCTLLKAFSNTDYIVIVSARQLNQNAEANYGVLYTGIYTTTGFNYKGWYNDNINTAIEWQACGYIS